MTNTISLSSMNLQELALLAIDIQQEMNSKNQQITELNQTMFVSLQTAIVSLQKIADLRGNPHNQEIVYQTMNPLPELNPSSFEEAEHNIQIEELESQVDEPNQEIEPTEETEHSIQIEELESQVEESNPNEPSQEVGFAEEANGDVETTPTEAVTVCSFPEYKDEEEYNLEHKRANMLQPFDSMVAGNLYTKVAKIGNNMDKTAAYRQNDRIIDAEGGCGNTLLTQHSPYVFIVDKKIVGTNPKDTFMKFLKHIVENVPNQDTDKDAKAVIGLAIKYSGISVKEALEYAETLYEVPGLTKKELKHIVDYHIKWNGKFGQMLVKSKKSRKPITEKMFLDIAGVCGLDAPTLLLENKMDECGWVKVLDVLKEVQTMGEDTKTEQHIEAHPIPTTCSKMKVLAMKNESGEIVAKFKTTLEAAAATGICRSSISKNSKKTYSGYKKLMSPKDGNYYTFEYLETCKTVAAKTPKRQYNRNKMVIVDIKSGVPTTYNSVKEAATATGMKYDQIVYRAKSSNHVLGTFEVWYEKDYMANVGMAA